MANIKTTIGGIEIDNPFVLGSGPLGWSAESLAECSRMGCGAVVTKSIHREACINPQPHMRSNGRGGLINSEGWSDFPGDYWFEGGIQKAKELGTKCLIANVLGETEEETISFVKRAIAAGADVIEMGGGGYFESGSLPETTKRVKDACTVPLLVKINKNWSNAYEMGVKCMEAGADGITAMDSMGPTMRIDLKTGHPMVAGYNGSGWSTGSHMLPFTIQMVHDLAKAAEEQGLQKDICGLGGIVTGEDALEMLLAGATLCGVCTAPIINGPEYFAKLNKGLSDAMDKYGYATIADAVGASLKPVEEKPCQPQFFHFDEAKCTGCRRCVKACCYKARTLTDGKMNVDAELCRGCGLCFDMCATGAITRD